jgi:hypothetical protein
MRVPGGSPASNPYHSMKLHLRKSHYRVRKDDSPKIGDLMVTRTAVIARQLLLVILACLGVTPTGITCCTDSCINSHWMAVMVSGRFIHLFTACVGTTCEPGCMSPSLHVFCANVRSGNCTEPKSTKELCTEMRSPACRKSSEWLSRLNDGDTKPAAPVWVFRECRISRSRVPNRCN